MTDQNPLELLFDAIRHNWLDTLVINQVKTRGMEAHIVATFTTPVSEHNIDEWVDFETADALRMAIEDWQERNRKAKL